MKIIYTPIFLKHDTGMHPENKKRLEALGGLEESRIPNATELLTLVHTADYIEEVKNFCQKGGGHLDADTVVSEHSYDAATAAVGATILAAKNTGLALVRPPGHHAHPSRASGFCVFNNVAIATQKSVNEGKRVLIFDFDGHLGDGTEKFFMESDQVLYWSLHQFPAFPGWGSEEQIGKGPGKGFTINVPLPPGSGDDLFWKAMNTLQPIIKQFDPDVVAVSAGFDAHQFDLLLDLRLSTSCFFKIGQFIQKNFKNVFATLEGGYNIEMLPKCIENFLNGCNGKKIAHKDRPTDSTIQVTDEFDRRLSDLEKNLSPYWKLS